ncbi:hypothetical protein LCGC14_2313200, partial [marine sediment metagenome]
MLLLFGEENPPNLISPSENILDSGQYSATTLTRGVNQTTSPTGFISA